MPGVLQNNCLRSSLAQELERLAFQDMPEAQTTHLRGLLRPVAISEEASLEWLLVIAIFLVMKTPVGCLDKYASGLLLYVSQIPRVESASRWEPYKYHDFGVNIIKENPDNGCFYNIAFICFSIAAVMGFTESKYNLSVCYNFGIGCQPDPIKASLYLDQAVAEGAKYGMWYKENHKPSKLPEGGVGEAVGASMRRAG